MKAARSYEQVCPVAAALDAVGDRWALLVVRELLLGPRRFSELAEELPGISTDVLTARLRAMEAAGVIRRSGNGRSAYELTEDGRGLAPIERELARWGAPRLRAPDSIDEVRPRAALTSLLLFPIEAPTNVVGRFEVRSGGEIARIAVGDGGVTVLPEPTATMPELTLIELTHAGLNTLVLGGRTKDLLRSGDLLIRGDRKAARVLLDHLAAAAPIAAAAN
jgi:DNA-binding HxlR family transcriptional regulator